MILKFNSRVSSLVGRFRNVPLLLPIPFPLTADCNRAPSSFANVRFFAFSFVNGFIEMKEKKRAKGSIFVLKKKNSTYNNEIFWKKTKK